MTRPLVPAFSEFEADAIEHETERFYAHLSLFEFSGDAASAVTHLLCTLPLSKQTLAHLRAQDPARLGIYRDLVRGTFRSAIAAAIPRTIARLGDQFEVLFSAFLAERATRSHLLRDLAGEFIAFCKDRSASSQDAYLWDLASLEAVRITVAAAKNTRKMPPVDLDLTRGLFFAEATQLLSFDYAVHELPDDEESRSLPDRRPTHILCYRDHENEVRYLELSPLAARVLGYLLSGEPLGPAVESACVEVGQALTQEVIHGTARMLADLAERTVITGVRPAPSFPSEKAHLTS